MEVFLKEEVVLNEDVISFNFSNSNKFGIKERMIMALHYSATLDKIMIKI